MPFQDEN